ncbi:hypothetical protein D9M69_592540 [compost metagenome]
MLQYMRERAVPHIMQQDSQQGSFFFCGRDHYPFVFQGVESLIHQVHGAQSMLKPAVDSARIDQFGQAQLPDPAQALKIRMLNHPKDKISGNGNEPVYRIIKYFPLIDRFSIQVYRPMHNYTDWF